MKTKKGISPVITTVILVAVGIAIAIAVALWMSGLVGIFTRFEKVEVRNSYASKPSGFEIVISFINTGSADTTIDSVLLNGWLYTDWGATLNDTLPLSLPVGNLKGLKVDFADGATSNGAKLVSGVTVNVDLHSTGGKDYSTAVTLP